MTNYTICSRHKYIMREQYICGTFTFSPLFIRSLFSTHCRCLLLFGHHIYFTYTHIKNVQSNHPCTCTFFSSEKFYYNNKDYIEGLLTWIYTLCGLLADCLLPITSNSSDCNPISVVAPRVMHPTERSHIKDLHVAFTTQQQGDPATVYNRFSKIFIFVIQVAGYYSKLLMKYYRFKYMSVNNL